jgi:predicted  nucleic acid-binding Zn-ribbon protein
MSSNYSCRVCGAIFADTAHLKRHLRRKNPCTPIIEKRNLSDEHKANPNRCRFCGRVYSRSDSLKRHLKTCKIANSDAGMNMLMEHTLHRQNAELSAKVDEQNAKIDRLTVLVEQLAVGAEVAPVLNIGTVNTATVTINIIGFDREDRLNIPASIVAAAFTENPRLVEYCRMSDEERVDADKAAPYVLEALLDLVRRAHRDPLYRNVHLNPKRADQVMVCVGEDQRWEVRGLIEVIRVLFDGVADNLHRLITLDKERSQLPFNVQSAASWVPNLYEDEPERFVKDGKAPMAAHLQNTTPTLAKP